MIRGIVLQCSRHLVADQLRPPALFAQEGGHGVVHAGGQVLVGGLGVHVGQAFAAPLVEGAPRLDLVDHSVHQTRVTRHPHRLTLHPLTLFDLRLSTASGEER